MYLLKVLFDPGGGALRRRPVIFLIRNQYEALKGNMQVRTRIRRD